MEFDKTVLKKAAGCRASSVGLNTCYVYFGRSSKSYRHVVRRLLAPHHFWQAASHDVTGVDPFPLGCESANLEPFCGKGDVQQASTGEGLRGSGKSVVV